MTKKEKVYLLKSYVMPILMYGAESWAWTNIYIIRLTAAEMRLLRYTGEVKRQRGKKKKIIRENLKINTLEGKVTSYRIQWYGLMSIPQKNKSLDMGEMG